MGVSKVVYGNDTLIDISGDTVSSNNLLSGATAHDSSGEQVVGAVSVPTNLDDLSDVDISSVDNGNVLRYNSISSKWENANGNSYWLSRSEGGSVTGDISLKKYASSSDTISLTIGGKVQENQSGVIGNLKLVNYSDGVIRLSPSSGSGSSPLINVPFKSGTIALTDDIPTDFVPASTGGTFEGDIVIDKADGTTSVVGQSKIVLGNSTLATADENSKGVMRVYTRGSKYVDICAPDNLNYADNRELNVPDKSGTIATTSDVSAIDLTKGGTIKADSGNTTVVVEGATSSDYGQIQLKRGGYAVRLTAVGNLTNNRDIQFPNTGGNVVVSSNYGDSYTATGSGSTLSNYETWKSLFNRVRTGSFSGVIRRSQLMCSTFDGQANTIFSCQRYQSGNYSIWGSFRGNGTSMIWYIVAFSSNSSVNVYKHVLTSSGLTVTTLTDEPAATSSDGTITPVTITII